MFCKRCGEQLSDNSKFCSRCGFKIEVSNDFLSKKKTRLIACLTFGSICILSLIISAFILNRNFFSEEKNTIVEEFDSEKQKEYYLKEEYESLEDESQIEKSDLGNILEFLDVHNTLKVAEKQLVKRINYYSADNECTSYVIPEYKNDREIGGKEYNTDGQETMSYRLEYDDKGNMIKETFFNQDDTIHYWNEYDYDENGNKLRLRQLSGKDKLHYFIEYQYDEQENCILEVQYNSYGTKTSHYVNEYDEQKCKIKSTYYNDYNDNIVNWIEYEYDTQGNCINEIWYEPSGIFMMRVEKQY